MPLLELFAQAEWSGFGFIGEVGVSPIDFASRLRQSALDGEITLWGKPRRYQQERLIRLEPWSAIPREHWKDFQINWVGAFQLAPPDGRIAKLASDNFRVLSQTVRTDRRQEEGFADLHIERKQSATWLKGAVKALRKSD